MDEEQKKAAEAAAAAGGDGGTKTPEEIVAEMKAENEALKAEKQRLEDNNRKLEEASRNQAHNFKKLRDLTSAEKEQLTAKELELMQRQEKIEEENEKARQEREEFTKKQHADKKEAIIKRFAGNDAEVKKLIEEKYDIINIDDSTDSGIEDRVKNAVALIKSTQPNTMLAGINSRGTAGGAPTPTGTGFAESSDGKAMMGAMGLIPPGTK